MQFFAFFGFVSCCSSTCSWCAATRPLVAALSLIPMAAAMMPSARGIAPRLVARIGVTRRLRARARADQRRAGRPVAAGCESSYWLLLAGLVPLGAGMGLAMTPATAAITDACPSPSKVWDRR